MAIELNPKQIGPASSGGVKSTPRRRQDSDRSLSEADSYSPPKARAHVNFIPAPESLSTLIDGAVAALRKGVYWDRGTILNLLV
jgi:hypothetical protein